MITDLYTRLEAPTAASTHPEAAQARRADGPSAQPGPQTEFLRTKAEIAVFGGSAGGGKTFALLLETINHTTNGKFDFAVFRRTSPQITAPGGLWDRASEIYPLYGAEPSISTLTWRFPTGAKGAFKHLQHEQDVYNWQGAEIALLAFDELSHFTERQFFYMLSRNRSVSGVAPYVRATTNPAPGWVKRFLGPWVDRNYPNPAASGEIRWFARIGGEIVWVAEDWRDAQGDRPKSVTFIRSSVYDNKILLAQDPGYLTNLKSLPALEQAQLLHGDWDVFAGSFFTEWTEATHTVPAEPIPTWWKFFGGLDYGQSAPFAFLLCAANDNGDITVVDEVYQSRLHPNEQAERIRQVLERHGVDRRRCPIWTDPSVFPPKDPAGRIGHPGKYIAEEYWEAGLNVAAANNDRLNGWARVRAYLHKPGGLTVIKGRCPNLIRTLPMAVYDERNAEDLDSAGEDHALDALRYALMSRPGPGKDPSAAPKLIAPGEWDVYKLRAPRYYA